jgi:DNA-directed RNA polymerase subunit M/transcription elongation factor TFIIS
MASVVDLREATRELAVSKAGLTEEEADDLERGVYNWTITNADEKGVVKNWANKLFRTLYQNKARSVLANLDKTSYIKNTRLVERLKEGEFQPHDIPFMAVNSVHPERWREIMEVKMKRDQQIGETTMTAMTDMFRCGKCRKRECVYYEKQVRSADEASTIFVRCLNCGNNWRIG